MFWVCWVIDPMFPPFRVRVEIHQSWAAENPKNLWVKSSSFRWTTAIELEEYSIFRHIHMASYGYSAQSLSMAKMCCISVLAQQKHKNVAGRSDAVSASAGRCGHRSSKDETWLLKWWSSMSGWPSAIDFLLIAIKSLHAITVKEYNSEWYLMVSFFRIEIKKYTIVTLALVFFHIVESI